MKLLANDITRIKKTHIMKNQIKSITDFNEPDWKDKERDMKTFWLKMVLLCIIFFSFVGFLGGMCYGVTKPRTRAEGQIYQEFPKIEQERDILKKEKLSCLDALFSHKQYSNGQDN